jgi:hypothetical protein
MSDAEEKRTIQIQIRLTPSEREILDAILAKKNNISISRDYRDYLRQEAKRLKIK